MRKAMFQTVKEIVRSDQDAVLLLADIGAMGFRDLIGEIPDRAMNFGICEDGMIGMAAGMSLRGMSPIVYGITPFLAERALEQIKLDFAYQKLDGIFLTTGASYDFSTLGYSHYCSEDFAVLKQIPGIEFVAPGSPDQMRCLLKMTYKNGNPTFFRMSDYCNVTEADVVFGKANVMKKGSCATVIAVSTMLDAVLEGCRDLDVTVLYYTTLLPFDGDTLRNNCESGRVFVCEPENRNSLLDLIYSSLGNQLRAYGSLGVPEKILRSYGTKTEKDKMLGLDEKGVQKAVEEFLNEKR